MRTRLSPKNKSSEGEGWENQFRQRLEKLEDRIKGIEETWEPSRYDKLEKSADGAQFKADQLYKRIEKLEHPINEQRERIVNLSPQLMELANHDLDMKERIDKFQYQVESIVNVAGDFRKRIEKLEGEEKRSTWGQLWNHRDRLETLEKLRLDLINTDFINNLKDRLDKLEQTLTNSNDMDNIRHAKHIERLGALEKYGELKNETIAQLIKRIEALEKEKEIPPGIFERHVAAWSEHKDRLEKLENRLEEAGVQRWLERIEKLEAHSKYNDDVIQNLWDQYRTFEALYQTIQKRLQDLEDKRLGALERSVHGGGGYGGKADNDKFHELLEKVEGWNAWLLEAKRQIDNVIPASEQMDRLIERVKKLEAMVFKTQGTGADVKTVNRPGIVLHSRESIEREYKGWDDWVGATRPAAVPHSTISDDYYE